MTAASPAKNALRLDSVAFRWPGRLSFRLSVPGFSVRAGERVLLLGESGSGKSTLLSLICGVVGAERGVVEVAGTDLTRLSAARRDRFRAEQIGVIFQMFNLLPYATALDNALLPLSFAPERRARVHAPETEARRLMAALGLPEEVISDAPAATLSVGQQQRVAAARALIGAPALIVADEPTSALDASMQAAFLGVLFDQVAAAGSTLLMVSHDARIADRFDRVVSLADVAEATRERAA